MFLSLSGLNGNCDCTGDECDAPVLDDTPNVTNATDEYATPPIEPTKPTVPTNDTDTNVTRILSHGSNVCGIHINSGTNCDTLNRAYFKKSKVNDKCPWLGANGAFYNNDGESTTHTA